MTELQKLAMPILSSQIEAAARFWKNGWESQEIVQVKHVFPNSQDAIKVKAIVFNALYGTNIITISKVADCVERVLKTNHSTGPNLVEELVAEIKNVTNRSHYSFAAKYAHFFIDSDLPILDSYAEWMVGKHIGSLKSKNPKRYLRLTEDIATLKRVAGLTCHCAELDAYLWVAGEYLSWKANPKLNISGDLRPYFDRLEKAPESEPDLRSLLGTAVGSAPTTLPPS
jgi:hypothetical protein